MRILFTCAAGYGHIHPMVPLARALAAAGHTVAFALPEEYRHRLEKAGFPSLPAGLGGNRLRDQVLERCPHPGSIPPEQRLTFAMTEIAGAVAAPAMMVDLLPLARQWTPDALVHDPSEFAAPLVAELLGIPSAGHGWGPIYPPRIWQAAGDAVAPLWREHNLEPAASGGVFRRLFFDVTPPSLQTPETDGLRSRAQTLRPVPFDAVGGESLPDWVATMPERPTVYATLGTMGNQAPGVLAAIVDGLGGEPVNVVLTIGPEADPAGLGPPPENVHIERYVPQSMILPHCDAVVTHGGSNSVIGALSHGLPVLLVPQAADQFENAERCLNVGAGRRLLPGELSPAAIRVEVGRVLSDHGLRMGAERVQEEIEAMPGPDRAVGILERLVRERRPPIR